VNVKRKKEYNQDKKTEKKNEKFQIQHGIIPNPAKQAQDNYDFGEDFWDTNPKQINAEKKQDNEDEDLKDVNAFEF